jgi:hypothetical protein
VDWVQVLLQQRVGSSRPLVRYDAWRERYFSSSRDGLSAIAGPGRRERGRGNGLGSRVFGARPSDWRVCWPFGSQGWNRSADALGIDNWEEKVLCSSGTCIGCGTASLVPELKGTNVGRHRGEKEEKPGGRKLRKAKKEEEFSANPFKKIQGKKIHFQPARFEGVPFRP